MENHKVGKNIWWTEGWVEGKYVIGLWREFYYDSLIAPLYVSTKEPKNKAEILKNLNKEAFRIKLEKI